MDSSKGSIVLSIIFLTLVLFLGLSLLNITIIHNRIVKARNFHRTNSESLHNVLIRHLHIDMNNIKNTHFGSSIENCNSYFNNNTYPEVDEGSIKIKKHFSFYPRDFTMFKIIKGMFEIEALGSSRRHKWKSSSVFNIFSGNIPINFVPIIINPINMSKMEKDLIYNDLYSINRNNIIISDHNPVFDISSYLANILRLEQALLTINSIIELYGHHEKCKGIYFIESETESGPLFVQGNVESITLSTEDDFQIVEIITAKSRFMIRYTNEGYIYQSDNITQYENRTFNQKIIINGNVKSLQAAGTPALASGSHPEFIVLGNINIFSSITGIDHNIHGIAAPGITIISAPSPFITKSKMPLVIFKPSGPVIIHGSININGILINNSDLTIYGNLYCRELKNSGKMKVKNISPLISISPDNFYLSDISFIRDFRIIEIDELFESQQ